LKLAIGQTFEAPGQERRRQRSEGNVVEAKVAGIVAEAELHEGAGSGGADDELQICAGRCG